MESEVPETPDLDIQDQAKVFSPVREETLVADRALYQTLVGDEALNQTLTDEQVPDQIMDDKSEPESEQGCFELAMDRIEDEELGYESVQSGTETSSSSGFKSVNSAEEEEALIEEEFCSAMSGNSGSLAEVDDVDFSDKEDCYMNGIPYRMWPQRRGYMHAPQFYRHHMWDMHHGLYPYRFPNNPISFWSPMGIDKESEIQANKFSLIQSNLDEINPAMVGAGLWNLGNTCFLNAILQCFTHTVPLIEGLRSYNHPKPCENDGEGFCVFCALHEHIELAISSKGKSLSPSKIVENLNQLSSDFRRHQQEDAHELLQCLLDKLNRSCNNLSADDTNASLVNRLFGGCLVSKLKCCSCGHCSNTFESLIDFSLEIENMSSLASALESFTNVEKIEDEVPQFTCESCKEKVAVEKQLMVDRAPSIAAFHLKRFKNNGSYIEKIDKHVAFPLELDLKPYTSGSQHDNVDLNYNLYAIVEHAGFSPTSGHYFCFIRSAPNTWFRMDDSQVTRVIEFHVLSRNAYILFYAKNGTPWFSTFMETEKLHLDSIVSTTSPKSVLETSNQNSGPSPTRKSNMISEVREEDRRQAMKIPGLCSKNFAREGAVEANISTGVNEGVTEDAAELSVTTISSPKSILDIDHISELSLNMENNISTDVNGDRRHTMEVSELSSDLCRYKDKVKETKDEVDSMKLSPQGATIGDTSVIFNSLPELFINTDHTSDSSSTVKANITNNVNGGHRSYTMEVSRLPIDDCLNKAKDDSKIEAGLLSSFLRDDSSNEGNIEFTKSSDLNPSSSLRFLLHVGISKLSFDGCKLKDREDDSEAEKNLSPSLEGEVGKSASVDSSTFSAKPRANPKYQAMRNRDMPRILRLSSDRQRKKTYKLAKDRCYSRRRSLLMAAVSNNRRTCLKTKSKINKSSRRHPFAH